MRERKNKNRTKRLPALDVRAATAAMSALLAVAAALLLAPNAQARLRFPPPQTISPTGESALGPEVAVDPQDRATVVWWRFDGANERIESVRLGTDGTPEEVETLLTTSEDRLLPAPQVAVDPQGRATVVWSRLKKGRTEQVQARRLGVQGAPEAVQTLAKATKGDRLGIPEVAVDSQGRPTVVWETSPGGLIQSTRGDNR